MMNCLLLLVATLSAFAVYDVSGQIHCYSCSSNFGRSYGSRNFNCAYNLTAVRTVRCSSGYYCLTSFTVEDGIVTYLRRSCQNPRIDQNQNTDEAPTEDGCTSSHSKYNSPDTTTCYSHCTTDRCNKNTPDSIQQCPEECPTSCNVLTAECSSPLSCVQCTNDNDKNCETNTNMTACPRASYNYCASSRTAVLNLEQEVVKIAVTKSCTTFTNSYSIPDQPCRFRSSSRSNSNNNQFVKYTCANFCNTDGCNKKIPGGKLTTTNTNALSCVVCSQTGTSGSCTSRTLTNLCPSSATYCKSTVTFYSSTMKDRSGRSIYQLSNVKRECSSEPVTKGCTTTDIEGTNLKFFTCQETCTSSGCNTGWPGRPKCTQCDVTNRTYSAQQFERCRARPSAPLRCPSPLDQYCTTLSNNTASDPNFPRKIKRACSAVPLETRCFDIPVSGGTTTNHCQSSCSTTGCNQQTLV